VFERLLHSLVPGMAREDLIEAILARLLLEPSFLKRMRADPRSTLEEYALGAEARVQMSNADFNQIHRFSGFISKVQHNHLWGSFPATRSLLAFYDIELDAFAEYRAIQLSPETLSQSRNDRIRVFLVFLKDYLRDLNCPGLLEVLAHERNVWECRVRASESLPPFGPAIDTSALSWPKFLRLSVRANETLQIGSYPFDPIILTQAVCQRQFDGKLPESHAHLMAYLADQKRQLRVLELDPLSVLIISHINRQRTAKAVIAAARADGLARVRPLAFREFFESAQSKGLISLVVGGT
jgi:hypothetical protein